MISIGPRGGVNAPVPLVNRGFPRDSRRLLESMRLSLGLDNAEGMSETDKLSVTTPHVPDRHAHTGPGGGLLDELCSQ